MSDALKSAVREAVGEATFADIQRLADRLVVSDARMLDFLSRKDGRVYRHQADCMKDLLRLLRSDAFPQPAPRENQVADDAW